MKIVYLILAHTDSAHLRKLVRALCYEDKVFFYIHIDARCDILPFTKALEGFSNVSFLKNRRKIYWGGYSMCEAEELLLEESLSSPYNFDRFILLSGLDYPLWSNTRMYDHYESNPNEIYMKAYNLSMVSVPRKIPQRIETYHFRDLPIDNALLRHFIIGGFMKIMNVFPIRKKNIIMDGRNRLFVYGGSQWFNLPRGCAEYVLKGMKNKVIRKYFKTSFAPDELLVHTILFNSQFKNDALCCSEDGIYPGLEEVTCSHCIEYQEGQSVFALNDYDKLITSDKMFCRKLQSGASDKLILLIDSYRNAH